MEDVQEIIVIDPVIPVRNIVVIGSVAGPVRPASFVRKGGLISDHFKVRPAGQLPRPATPASLPRPVQSLLSAAEKHAAAQKQARLALSTTPGAAQGRPPHRRRVMYPFLLLESVFNPAPAQPCVPAQPAPASRPTAGPTVNGKHIAWTPEHRSFAVERVKSQGSVQKAMDFLLYMCPKEYKGLRHSTLTSWVKSADAKAKAAAEAAATGQAPAGGSVPAAAPPPVAAATNKGRPSQLPVEAKQLVHRIILAQVATSNVVNSAVLRPQLISALKQEGWGHVLAGGDEGGIFKCSESWIRKVCSRELDLSQRVGTTAAQKLPADFEAVSAIFDLQVAQIAYENDLRPELIVNADQTGINIVPVGKRTYRKKGVKEVSMLGLDDKRQLTLLPATALDGTTLPFQVIFTGTTARCLPAAALRKHLEDLGWHFTQTSTHWSSLETMCAWVDLILIPYLLAAKKRLNLAADHPCMLLLDVWKVHLTLEFRDHLKKAGPWVILKYIPAGCTSKKQPADVGCQAPMKHAIKTCFHTHVGEDMGRQMAAGKAPEHCTVNMRISAMKPLVVKFLEAGFLRLRDDPKRVRSAWRNAGFSKTFDPDFQRLANKEAREGRLFPIGYAAAPNVDDGEDQPGKYDPLPEEDDMLCLTDLRDKVEAGRAAAPALAAAISAAAGSSRAAAAAAGLAAAGGSVAVASGSGSGAAPAAAGSSRAAAIAVVGAPSAKKGRGRPRKDAAATRAAVPVVAQVIVAPPAVAAAAVPRAPSTRKRAQPVVEEEDAPTSDSSDDSNDSSSGHSSSSDSE